MMDMKHHLSSSDKSRRRRRRRKKQYTYKCISEHEKGACTERAGSSVFSCTVTVEMKGLSLSLRARSLFPLSPLSLSLSQTDKRLCATLLTLPYATIRDRVLDEGADTERRRMEGKRETSIEVDRYRDRQRERERGTDRG